MMTKNELVKVLALRTKISEDQASSVIDAFIDQIKEQLSRGEKVTISGFGSFVISQRKAKTFVNPKTGVAHQLPERVLPHFKAGEVFRRMIKPATS
jgi:DNA-binding protein HU-beta